MTNTLKPDFATDDELQGYLEYLDDLRDSGATNMFGAASWLESDFELDKKQARLILAYWMDTFGTRHGDKEESNV